jgi:Rieske Fe-S protein
MTPSRPVSRRAVVTGAGAAVGAGLLVTGCSTAQTGSGEAAGAGTSTAAGTPLGSTAEVPVGGAAIFADQGVVVTQATAGNFAGYSTICPHQGCAVASVTDGEIECPCHGSRFALDGSVVTGPARQGLDGVPVRVEGDRLTLG